ncbi:MAG: hypothetical protein N3E46_05120 [Gemmataceae bacterium]|uniref:Uncharacterized protein n=1 Tax=Thermogemmata fonticola TaxID=2755323 RepID=A0A7V8VFW7_9BACT|nr:hypothetical protein [Thermogemmata fonticola]MBA2227052.1 hypothetical protein [Thermogemmata fonticola]MCX8139041.1 hypothetical protein [Gemmataceae bacterium]
MRGIAVICGVLSGLTFLAFHPDGRTQPKTPPASAQMVPSTLRAFIVQDGRFPPQTVDGKMQRDPRDRSGKIHCYVCEYGLSPVFILFLRADPKQITADTPVGKLIRDLDAVMPKYRADKLNGLILFLRTEAGEKAVKFTDDSGTEIAVTADKEYPDDENRDRYVQEIKDWIQAMKIANIPVGLAPLTSKNLTAWGVQDKDAATVVVYRRLKHLAPPWHFPTLGDLNEEQAKSILQTVLSATRY